MATIKELTELGLKVARMKEMYRIENTRFKKVFFISPETMARYSAHDIEVASHGGQNVEHITRVTGYFSRLKSWNKGKIAELKDRHRSKEL